MADAAAAVQGTCGNAARAFVRALDHGMQNLATPSAFLSQSALKYCDGTCGDRPLQACVRAAACLALPPAARRRVFC